MAMESSGVGEKRKSDSLKQDEEDTASQIACDNCRTKKYKCSRELPACLLCLRHDRPCHYSGRISRTPLTRVHLTEVENRLQAYEAVFAHFLPGIDINEAISSLSSSQVQAQHTTSRLPGSTTSATENNPIVEDSSPDALPQEADGFDWKEEAVDMHSMSNGMAALSVKTSRIGYLGSTSSVGFLRSLHPWITTKQISLQSSHDPFQSPHMTAYSLSPMTQFPEHALSHQLFARLFDSYFINYHTLYPFIHEATFRAQYNEQVKRPEKHAWDMLVYSILALGAWTSESGTEDNDLHDFFYQKATSLWQERFILESGSVTLVQALLLLSNYSQKRNKVNTGWNFLGLAVRVAVGLGLHKELPKWNVNFLHREIRRRVWWSLLIVDSGASKTLGRPLLLPNDDEMDIKQVLNVPDELLTPLTETTPDQVDEPTLYSGLIAAADFHLAANTILKRLLSSTGISAREAIALNGLLTRWSAALPGYFQINQAPLSSLDWWVSRCFRPGKNFDDDSEEMECKNLCISSAHETIISVGRYIRQHSLTKTVSWYALYFMFHAALVIAVCLCADPTSPDSPLWANDLDITKAALVAEFSTDKLARQCHDILSALQPHDPSDEARNNLPPLRAEDMMPDFQLWSSPGADFNSFDWSIFGDDFNDFGMHKEWLS